MNTTHTASHVTRLNVGEIEKRFSGTGEPYWCRTLVAHDGRGTLCLTLFSDVEGGLTFRHPPGEVAAMLRTLSPLELDGLARAVHAERVSRMSPDAQDVPPRDCDGGLAQERADMAARGLYPIDGPGPDLAAEARREGPPC
jgi:hypothetical protein